MAREARADERAAVELVLNDEACASPEPLVLAAQARGIRLTLVPRDPPRGAEAVRYDARMTAVPSGISLEIDGAGPGGTFEPRRFDAASCHEAIEALAVVLAIGRTESVPAPAPEAPPPAPPVVAAESRARVLPALASGAPARADGLTGYVAAGAGAHSLAEGQGLVRLTLGLRRHRSFLPWLEAGLSVGLPRTLTGGGGAGDLGAIGGRVAVAPLGWGLGSGVSLSIPVAVEVGALTVTGIGPAKVQTATRPTVTASLGARFRFDFGRRFFAEGEASGLVSFLRDDFVFVNGGTTYRAPVLSFALVASVGVTFP